MTVLLVIEAEQVAKLVTGEAVQGIHLALPVVGHVNGHSKCGIIFGVILE